MSNFYQSSLTGAEIDEALQKALNTSSGNMLDTADPIYSTCNMTKDGKTVKLTYPGTELSDVYFNLRLKDPIVTDTTYTLSFDCTGVDTAGDRVPSFQIASGWGSLTLSDGRNKITFTANADRSTNFVLDDEQTKDTRPSNTNIILSNFQLEEGSVATDYNPNLQVLEEDVDTLNEEVDALEERLPRSFTSANAWNVCEFNGEFCVAQRNVEVVKEDGDKSLDVVSWGSLASGIVASEYVYEPYPFPMKSQSLAVTCDRDGQYISSVGGMAGDATIGVKFRIFDPTSPSEEEGIDSTYRMIMMGQIATPPAEPTKGYNEDIGGTLVAIADSYVTAQGEGRNFVYDFDDKNFFIGDQEGINNANGAGLMQCDTFVGLVLRGITYKNSPYNNTEANATYTYDDLMANATCADECATIRTLITSGKGATVKGRDMKYADDYAMMAWGLNGSVFSDPAEVQPGDIAFWKNPETKNWFDNIVHVALVGEVTRTTKDDDTVEVEDMEIYEVSGADITEGKYLHKIALSERNDRAPDYFARVAY